VLKTIAAARLMPLRKKGAKLLVQIIDQQNVEMSPYIWSKHAKLNTYCYYITIYAVNHETLVF
jgi:hypothetical protein